MDYFYSMPNGVTKSIPIHSSAPNKPSTLAMATSFLSPLSAPPSSTIDDFRAFGQVGPSPFLQGAKLFSAFPSPSSFRRTITRRCFRSPFAQSLDHIPKKFREENLKDGCEFLSLSLSIFKHTHPSFLYYFAPCSFQFTFFLVLGLIKGHFNGR